MIMDHDRPDFNQNGQDQNQKYHRVWKSFENQTIVFESPIN